MWKVFKDCKQTISGLVSKLFPHRMSFWHSCLEYGISMCKPNLNKFRLIFFLSPGLLVSGWRRRRCRSSVAGQGLLHKLCLYSSNSWGVMRNNFSLGNHAQKNGKNNLECWWWCTGRTSLSILALGKDQLKGRIWILKAWGLVVVMDQTPWWGSLYVVPVNAEKISLNVASSHQVTQLLLVPRNNLLIGFCTGFTVKTGGVGVHESAWKAQFMLLAEQTLNAPRQTHFVITGPFNLCCLVALFSCSSVVGSGWVCEHLSLRDVPHVSFHCLLHRRSENCSLVFWKGLISGRRSGFFFLSFQFWFVADDIF